MSQRRAHILTYALATLIVFGLNVALAASSQPADISAPTADVSATPAVEERQAGPPPDGQYRAPWKINNQANTLPITDGAGKVWIIARAAEGPYAGSVVVFHPDGRCSRLCDIDASGAASVILVDGYPMIISVARNQLDILYWILGPDDGFTRIPELRARAMLPAVIR